MSSWYRVSLIRIAAFICLSLTATGLLLAQTNNGSIRGQVTDPSGAAVQGAAITVTTPSGQMLTTTSNQDGAYDVRNLAPGTYTVEAAKQGFAPFKQDAVNVAAGQVQQFNISFSIAGQEQKVTVNGDAPTALDVTPSSNVSALVIEGKELEALPDDPDELQSDLEALAGPSAGPNGGQMYIDGFTAGQLPPKSSIREIRLNQNPFSSEYDKVGFGRIEIFTKPGTDQWHGQASINGNDSAFNTKNPFATSEPGYESTQWNGNIGGPLNKNSSFFMNADYRDIHDESIVSAEIFNPAQPCSATGPCGTPFSDSIAFPRTRINLGPRLDYQLGKTNTLSVRYQYWRDSESNQGVGAFSLASTGYSSLTTEQTIQISDTQTISSKIINETHFQYLRDQSSQLPVSTLPTIFVLGAFTSGGSGDGNIRDNTNHYELQNYTSISLAKHFIKFGARLREVTDANFATSGFNGTFIFPSLNIYAVTQQDLANGMTPAQIAAAGAGPNQLSLTTGSPNTSVNMFDAGLYAEDDWRIRPNITLSYGLRFETQTHIADHADFAPRLGLAWGIGRSKTAPKTVLRAGFGIFYDRFTEALILQAERLNGTAAEQCVISNPFAGNFASSYPNSPSVSLGQCPGPTLYQIAPQLHAPGTMQTGVSVERQLTKIANLSVSYLNSRGFHQLLTNNVNSPVLPGTFTPTSPANGGVYPNSIPENIYQYQSDGLFRQNQLITNINVRAGARLTLNAYYALNYANSDTSGANGFPSNPYDILADYGRASFDVRNKVFFGGTIAAPYGLRLSPFMVFNSGSPYSVTIGKDLIGSSLLNQRPGFVSSTTCSTTTVSTTTGYYCTPLGTFNPVPTPGEPLVPINDFTGPNRFSLNLRISKTFGFGQVKEAAGPRQRNGGGGGGRNAGGGGRGGGFAPRPGGGGGGLNAPPSRYNLTLSANARNVFNNVNVATPVGNLGSRLLGQSNAVAGGPFSSGAANRQIYLQLSFSF